jgi:hypothetical protein
MVKFYYENKVNNDVRLNEFYNRVILMETITYISNDTNDISTTDSNDAIAISEDVIATVDDDSIISSEDDDIPINNDKDIRINRKECTEVLPDKFKAVDLWKFFEAVKLWDVTEAIFFIFFHGVVHVIFRLSLRHSTYLTLLHKDVNVLMNVGLNINLTWSIISG